ncbi:alpha/beta hydrolase [Solitalea canadensis]|uniref:Esterase/lipase n=1 Tax=Solitalea canadensis (strain ATCC 29591 / DSM 3403 / JCM 21819 / LMG 8368 / NBRC 15130 / NCIMB 12057 / USAM 9D) TaxID=929556 RepID=H8KSI9_SOLCM|nr:alpha/beta hydrolase [Solitalea canadensis]AFD08540.1 esterase/lipase [Solitalea canadensis DSM 3403]
MTKYALSIGVCLLLLFSACKKNLVPPVSDLEAKQILDVAYGSADQQKFDVYLPANRTAATKVIVFLHGGSWRDEDKSQYTSLFTYFVDKGFAVINMNYRLAKDNSDKHPAQMEDIRSALDLVLARRNEYVISDKIGLTGNSAGGHLALLYAYGFDIDERVKAVAALSAPTDFVQAANSGNTAAITTINYFLGKSFDEDQVLWVNASPYFRATAASVPTILFVGGKDDIVYPIQSENLKTRLTDLGVMNQLIVYPDEGHAWIGTNLTDTQQKIVDWFTVNM